MRYHTRWIGVRYEFRDRQMTASVRTIAKVIEVMRHHLSYRQAVALVADLRTVPGNASFTATVTEIESLIKSGGPGRWVGASQDQPLVAVAYERWRGLRWKQVLEEMAVLFHLAVKIDEVKQKDCFSNFNEANRQDLLSNFYKERN